MMTLHEALAPIASHRVERVVISTMSAVAEWPKLSDGPRDFNYLPSSMGQAIPLGLGLALAKPNTGIIVISGDGGLLMNLGCLVTLAQHAVPVCVVLIDNGLYEVTGGQVVPGAGTTDFAGLAKAAGIAHVWAFDLAPEWADNATQCLTAPTPAFVWLKVEGRIGQTTPKASHPMAEQIARLQASLGVV